MLASSISLQNVSNAELLIHNVSHSDIILSLNNEQQSLKPGLVIARPKFNYFRELTKKINEKLISMLQRNDGVEQIIPENFIIRHEKYRREALVQNPVQYALNPELSHDTLPIGFNFTSDPILVENLSTLRFRREDKQILTQSETGMSVGTTNTSSTCESVNTVDSCCDNANNSISNQREDGSNPRYYIDHVYFPLLSILIPKWLKSIHYHPAEAHRRVQLVMFLVTGRGTPNDPSTWIMDNSTKIAGQLMIRFLEQVYPFIQVQQLHSSINLFRYDENILFVKQDLLPRVDALRDRLINYSQLPPDRPWKNHFHVTLSFADGSSARVSSINASLKHYRYFIYNFDSTVPD
jgi:hypothetical protein